MLEKIWIWTKRISLILFGIGAFIFAIITMRGRDKPQDRTVEIDAAERRIEANLQEAERLETERKDAERGIQDTSDRYKDKLKDNENKPEKPGDAGKSSDDLTKNW